MNTRLLRASERTRSGGRLFRDLGQLQPVTLAHGRFGLELRCEGVDANGAPVLKSFPLPRFKAAAKAAIAELEQHRAAGTRTPAAAWWHAYQSRKDDGAGRPMAAKGLTSYRCKGAFGWIMIGATDHADALSEARRSSAAVKPETLEIWDGTRYVPVAECVA